MITPICLLDKDECSEESTNVCDVYEDCTNALKDHTIVHVKMVFFERERPALVFNLADF